MDEKADYEINGEYQNNSSSVIFTDEHTRTVHFSDDHDLSNSSSLTAFRIGEDIHWSNEKAERPPSRMSEKSFQESYDVAERFDGYFARMDELLRSKVYEGDLIEWEKRYQRLQKKYKSYSVSSSVSLSEIHELQDRLNQLGNEEQQQQIERLRNEKKLSIMTQNLLLALGILLVSNERDAKNLTYLQKTMVKNVRRKLIKYTPPSHPPKAKKAVKELQKYLDDWRFSTERMEKLGGTVLGTLTMFVCVQYKILKHVRPKVDLLAQLAKFETFLEFYRNLAKQASLEDNTTT